MAGARDRGRAAKVNAAVAPVVSGERARGRINLHRREKIMLWLRLAIACGMTPRAHSTE